MQNIGQSRNYFAVNNATRLANFTKYLKASKPLARFTATTVSAEMTTSQSKWVGRWLGTCAGMCFGAVVIGIDRFNQISIVFYLCIFFK